ncbi:MAG TPA: respiratory nitrate reductase subunit gamma [Actinomycetales bacterium]|nr:respiratory nitrate reductase subunit gamma [Actinomycetales bacterium]
MSVFLWGVLPYLTLLLLVAGLTWRYKYDQFGWTTRSSQLYESRMLKVASPLFHYALLGVFIGHIVGLLIPKTLTDRMGISQEMYHLGAFYIGGLAGLGLVIGLALLIWRRRRTTRVFKATTINDKAMYLVLAIVIAMGMLATFTGDVTAAGEPHNYRETISVWFRSLIILQPDIAAMEAATWQFQVHTVVALLLFAMTPFTRLVHAFTAPVHYLFRPYVVFRSRDIQGARGSKPRRGWEPAGIPDQRK